MIVFGARFGDLEMRRRLADARRAAGDQHHFAGDPRRATNGR